MFRFDTPTSHLRSVTILEGISYLVLLFIAMPLKYLADQPMAVRVVGMAHGVLFMWLMALLYHGWTERERGFGWAFKLGVASVIPFGMFLVDGQLKREDEEFRAGSAGDGDARTGA